MKRVLLVLFFTIAAPFAGASAQSGADAASWTQSFVDSADSTTIAYYVAGELSENATPLIVISGGPGSDHRYMRVGGSFARLSADRPVVMFDQRGTSLSGSASATPELSDWADDVEAIRLAVGAEAIDLLGHSFGGLVSMAYADDYRDRVRSITFADSTAPNLSENVSLLADVYPDRIDTWADVRASLPSRFPAPTISVFFSMEFVDPAMAPLYEEAVSRYVYNIDVNNQLREQLQEADYTDTVASLDRPVLILHGRQDAVIAPSTAWRLHQLIAGSRIEYIDASGHLPFVEQPDRFVEILADFLSGLD